MAGQVDRRLGIDLELFSRGGLAVLEKIRRQDYDVIAERPKVSKSDRVSILLGAIVRRGLSPRSGADPVTAAAPANDAR